MDKPFLLLETGSEPFRVVQGWCTSWSWLSVRCGVVCGVLWVSSIRRKQLDRIAGLIDFGIQLSMNFETGFGRGRRDQIDDCLEALERFSAPVLGNVREEPMFDLVPLAGSGREVTDHDTQPGSIGQPFPLCFPEP